MLPGHLTSIEFRRVVADYKRLLKSSEIVISVVSTKGKVYRAALVNQNDALDLALLKIDFDEQLPPFPVGDSASLKVGDSVVSIGYPLPNVMGQFLDDFKPTVTNGILSAVRKDKWDLQHTAATNPGNSGGPLMSGDGMVVGVIVGTVTGANALHFAVSSDKLIEWLTSLGKLNLLTREKGDAQ